MLSPPPANLIHCKLTLKMLRYNASTAASLSFGPQANSTSTTRKSFEIRRNDAEPAKKQKMTGSRQPHVRPMARRNASTSGSLATNAMKLPRSLSTHRRAARFIAAIAINPNQICSRRAICPSDLNLRRVRLDEVQGQIPPA